MKKGRYERAREENDKKIKNLGNGRMEYAKRKKKEKIEDGRKV
jgi:hypothetical protein